VRTDERDRLAIHYHQSYQVRHFRSLSERAAGAAGCDYPLVHLFRRAAVQHAGRLYRLHARLLPQPAQRGRLVFLCVHPNERFHLEILEEICERFIFVQKGTVTPAPTIAGLVAHEPCRAYLGDLLTERA
jgi:hypothetical protein